MGGRGATSGIDRISADDAFINKYSERMSATEISNAVADKANFIFRDLEQDDAIQIIIRRSFKGGVPEVSISTEGLIKSGLNRKQAADILKSVEAWINKFNRDFRETDKRGKASSKISDRQRSEAEKKAIMQARSEFKKAKKHLRKNYRL